MPPDGVSGICGRHRSTLYGDQVIFGANPFLAVESLEAANREMPASYILEMRDERVVYRRAAEGADEG